MSKCYHFHIHDKNLYPFPVYLKGDKSDTEGGHINMHTGSGKKNVLTQYFTEASVLSLEYFRVICVQCLLLFLLNTLI